MDERQRIIAEELTKQLAQRGKLIESGWAAYKYLTIPKDAPQIQIDEMKLAFMAGAQHLFASIMTILDPGEEPTDADLKKMHLISNELEIWREVLKLRYEKPQGQA